jgi:hypothetical protein
MRTTLLMLAAALAAGATMTAQEPKKKDDGKAAITVTGCVDGGWLHVRVTDPFGSYAERYRLRGAKQLLKEMAAQHNGHLLEVTGKVTDTKDTEHAGKTTQVGKKTRIIVGAKDVPQVPSGQDPTLDVLTYRELTGSCS